MGVWDFTAALMELTTRAALFKNVDSLSMLTEIIQLRMDLLLEHLLMAQQSMQDREISGRFYLKNASYNFKLISFELLI